MCRRGGGGGGGMHACTLACVYVLDSLCMERRRRLPCERRHYARGHRSTPALPARLAPQAPPPSERSACRVEVRGRALDSTGFRLHRVYPPKGLDPTLFRLHRGWTPQGLGSTRLQNLSFGGDALCHGRVTRFGEETVLVGLELRVGEFAPFGSAKYMGVVMPLVVPNILLRIQGSGLGGGSYLSGSGALMPSVVPNIPHATISTYAVTHVPPGGTVWNSSYSLRWSVKP
eukprot:360433-Chlamydomonas_euryale.AAC.10